MKLDFVISSLNAGGAERVMVTLVNGLSKSHKIRLITFNRCEEMYALSDSVVRVKLYHGVNKNHTIRAIKNLNNFYRSKNNRPDALISFIHMNNFIAIVVGKFRGMKVIVSEHTNHTVVMSKKVKWIREYFYRYANATTVLTSFDVPYYTKHGANVTIMPNPLNLPKTIKAFSKRKSNILVVGALNRYVGKGFDGLLHLIAPILNKNPDWSLTIAGSGNKGLQVLRNLAKELKLEDQIIFTGFCKNIQDLMQDSQIFVLPSKYEGLPMGLMEALSNGMACVAYDCPSGPHDLIENKVNGLLINNQDTQAMQSGLLRVMDDYIFREKLASNAPSSMQAYSLDSIMGQWESLINFVVTNNGANLNADE